MNRRKLRTAELAAMAGVKASAIRYYERRGLLGEPGRSATGYREYPPEAVATLQFIKRAQDLGFTLREIKQLLNARHSAHACDDACELAERKAEELSLAAQQAAEARQLLLVLIEGRGARARSSRSCPVIRHMEGRDDTRRRDRGS